MSGTDPVEPPDAHFGLSVEERPERHRGKAVRRGLIGLGVVVAMLTFASSALFAYERVNAGEGDTVLVERIAALEAQNDELRSQLAANATTTNDAISGLRSTISSTNRAAVFFDNRYAAASHTHLDFNYGSYADKNHSHYEYEYPDPSRYPGR